MAGPFILDSTWVRAMRGAPPVGMQAHPAATPAFAPDSIAARWLAQDGSATGPDFAIEIPPDVPMEAYLPEGKLGHVMATPGAECTRDRPDGAVFLQLDPDGAKQVVAMDALAPAPPADATEFKRFGPPGARFVFPVFAERYTDRDRFFADMEDLYRWIVGVPPFDEAAIRVRFGLVGYFWPTDPVVGQCDTPDIVYDCAHPPPDEAVVFHGNNNTAKARFGSLMRDRRYGLVLIDSRVRGGAGGLADWGYPAWSSTTACPRETWQGIALHEIGHALGLADEYVHAARASESWKHERNVTDASHASGVAWNEAFTVQPPTDGSVFTLAEQRALGSSSPEVAPDYVGLFQGARYREDLYRPSFNCLMKATNYPAFCRICAAEIRRVI